jgi:hypothetical protein
MTDLTADQIIVALETHGLGWSLDHTGINIEARIWEWPYVVGRYHPNAVAPLADMLRAAIATMKPNTGGYGTLYAPHP